MVGKGRVTVATAPLRLQSDIHREKITLYLIDSPGFPVVLGLPWLNRHNACIDWATGTIREWGPTCHATCLLPSPARPLVEPVEALELAQVPVEYLDLKEVFSRVRESTLPPHRLYDCSIELLSGTSPSHVRSLPEREAMDKCIKEALALYFIQPSTSPAGAGFFFVGKKDGGLRPSIDYRSLNKITIRNRYPLPLMSTAFDLLQRAKVFTKLDLRNAYRLIRIREGDEW